MPITENPAIFISDNWIEVKQHIIPFWKRLTENDIQSFTNYADFIKKLKEIYHLSPEELNTKLAIFISTLELETSSEKLNKLKDILYQYTFETKNQLNDSLKKILNQIVFQLKNRPIETIIFGILVTTLAIKCYVKK